MVTGASGQLGSQIVASVPAQWRIITPTSVDLNFLQPDRLSDFVRSNRPDVVINCAAYTDVDGAETAPETAMAVNATAATALATVGREVGARVVHVSTDYVFDGTADAPYPEDAPISGLGVYGRSKAAGEAGVLAAGGTVVRTAWLYAPGHRNFVSTILRLAASGGPLRVVDDQLGQPTYAADLAERLIAMVQVGFPAGIYHGTNSGETSWFGFAEEIVRLWGIPVEVQPVTSDEFPRPAPRPAYSVLGHEAWAALGMTPMRDWRAALADAHGHHRDGFLSDFS